MGSYLSKPDPDEGSVKLIDRLVDGMQRDGHLMQNLPELLAGLQLSEANCCDIKEMKNRGEQIVSILRTVVTIWHSSQANPTCKEFCRVLRGLGYKNAAERIEKPNMDTSFYGKRISAVTKREQPSFYGRESELQQIRKAYDSWLPLIVIYGCAGYGKTELAVQFVRQLVEKNESVSDFMIQADNAQNLHKEIRQMFEQITQQTLEPNIGVSDCVNALKRLHGRIVLILDNVDQTNTYLNDVLHTARAIKPCFTIVTTRDLQVIDYNREKDCRLNLNVFSPETASMFVNSRIEGVNEWNVQQLCETLGYWPLSLVLATAYINRKRTEFLEGSGYSINKFIEEFESSTGGYIDADSGICESLFKTLSLAVENIRISNTAGVEILTILSCLNPDGVTVRLVEFICNDLVQPESEKITNALLLLKRYCIISCDNNIVRMHRVTQKVVQRMQGLRSNTMRKEKTKLAQTMLNALDKCKKDFPQEDSCNIELMWTTAVDGLSRQNCEIYRAVVRCISDRMIDLSYIEQAKELCKTALPIVERFDTTEDTLTLEYNIARCESYMKNFAQSYRRFEDLRRKLHSTPRLPSSLTSNVTLEFASLKKSMGKVDAALTLYQDICNQEKLDENCGQTYWRAKHGVAICLKEKREYSEALKIFTDVLEHRKEMFGEKDFRYMRALCFTLECRFDMGDFQKCVDLCCKALAIQSGEPGSYPPDHPNVTKTLTLFVNSCIAMSKGMDGVVNLLPAGDSSRQQYFHNSVRVTITCLKEDEKEGHKATLLMMYKVLLKLEGKQNGTNTDEFKIWTDEMKTLKDTYRTDGAESSFGSPVK